MGVILHTVTEGLFALLMPIVEGNYVPDFILRWGIRVLLWLRLRELTDGGVEAQQQRESAFVKQLKTMPIAINTGDANEQHYEVDTDFYDLCLGKNKKYSCCIWEPGTKTLEDAEMAAFKQICHRARVSDGMDILDLGCGWGSLSLYLAKTYPNARITGVSNSKTQREHIMRTAKDRGLGNVEIITCDINNLHLNQKFDRVISIEMFEHMKNYQKLLALVRGALKPTGLLFVHIFSHIRFSYHFDDGEDGGFNWMAKTFFTGGTMPSQTLFYSFQDDMKVIDQWDVNGTHYSKTLEAWLQRLDRNQRPAKKVLMQVYGKGQETKWLVNWRLFFLACSELFNYNQGNEWIVSHYLFEARS